MAFKANFHKKSIQRTSKFLFLKKNVTYKKGRNLTFI